MMTRKCINLLCYCAETFAPGRKTRPARAGRSPGLVVLRIAAGEEESGRPSFIELMDRGRIDVVQVDLTRCGGFTEAMKIAALAWDRGLPVANHGFTTYVNVTAALHWLNSIPNALICEFVAEEVVAGISRLVELLAPGEAPQHAGAANIGVFAQPCDVGVHVGQGLVHLELEPRAGGARAQAPTVVAQAMVAQANSAIDMADFFRRCAHQVRQLSGYDRVMVYRFRHDDAGEVVAESRDEAMESYLGLRFPASDIPAQARALYVRNRIRVIPDAGYRAVAIVPGVHDDGAPLDLGQHALRSVSPVHLEYLRNMGVWASMSISIHGGPAS